MSSFSLWARALILGFLAIQFAYAQKYTLVDLGNGSTGLSSPRAINNDGIAVGFSLEARPPFGHHPFRWHDGTSLDLGTFGGPIGFAVSINSTGKIVGSADLPIERKRAFLWSEDIGLQNLGILPGYQQSLAYGINDYDQIVGFSVTPNPFGSSEPFLWQKGEMISLGAYAGYIFNQALKINNWGLVIGYSNNTNFTPGSRPWLWYKDFYELPELIKGEGAVPHAVNDLGQIVGMAFLAPTNAVACLWDNGEIINLDTLSDGNSAAWGINQIGQVVGSFNLNSQRRAFLWHKGTMVDLNDYLPPGYEAWRLDTAFYINDNGTIVGEAFVTNRGWRGFMLIPN